MSSLSQLEPYLRGVSYDLYELEKFFRDGLNYDSECEERAIKQFAGNVMRAVIGITETITDEGFLSGDDERVEEAIALCFNQFRDKRDDRNTPEASAAYAADQARSLHNV